MKRTTSVKKQLEEILVSGEFTRLSQFRNKETWSGMASDERELLGTLFVMQGEKELKEGDRKVLETFKLASKIAPKSPMILYRQAIAFAGQDHNMYCLTSASRLFEKLTQIDKGFFDAWHGWGNVLVKLGIFSNELSYFVEADRVFQQAEKLAEKNSTAKIANLYRHWGVCWYFMGKLSGEAVDFRTAIDKYRKAFEHGLKSTELYNDYGNVLVELAHLINNNDFLLEAVEFYWKAIRQAPDYLEGWLNLALTFSKLYQMTVIDTYFNLAVESFENASKLEPDQSFLWLKWGQLLLMVGKMTKDPEKLKESCEKLEVADVCEPNEPMIISSWAEAQMGYGFLTDQLQHLYEAEEKISQSIELQRDNPVLWALYARCLMELGRYFSDVQYFKMAIEKFQYALSLDRNDYEVWYGLILAHASVGELLMDKKSLKQAAKLCMRVIDNGGGGVPAFWNDWGVIMMRLAMLTQEKRYIEAALTKFEQAIRLKRYDSYSDTVEAEWFYNYGCALDYLGDYRDPAKNYEKAVEVFSRALEIDPDFIQAHFSLAETLTNLGEINSDVESYYRALEHFETYVNYESEDDVVWCGWGLTLIHLALLVNDPTRPDYSRTLFDDAERKLMQAAALGNTSSFYHLACLYSLTGNHSLAMHYLEKAKGHGVLESIEDLMHDDWLQGVRQTPAFQNFISQMQ